MSSKRNVATLTAAVLAAATLASCADSERERRRRRRRQRRRGTFVFGAAGAPEMFDPFYATDGETFRVTRQMFEGLVGIKPGSAEVVPELATEWTPNEDGTEWTFTLPRRRDLPRRRGVQRRGRLLQLRPDVRPERGRPDRR